MKGFTVAEARARFGDLLDQAEQSDSVLIERHGVRFVLKAEANPQRAPSGKFFAWMDPAVEAGDWSWDLGRTGARLKARRPRKAR
jgi:hypothetical protein